MSAFCWWHILSETSAEMPHTLQALEKVAFQMERKLKAQRMAEEAQHLRDSASHTAAQKLAQNSHQAANVSAFSWQCSIPLGSLLDNFERL